MPFTRRKFLISSAALAAASTGLRAQNATHPDVGAIDRERILAAAERALKVAPKPLIGLEPIAAGATSQDFQLNLLPPAPKQETDTPVLQPSQPYRDRLQVFCDVVTALAAAYVITKDDRYAGHAAVHLAAWFIDPATRMTPDLDHARLNPMAEGATGKSGDPEAIYETTRLAEVAVAIAHLARSESFDPVAVKAVKTWFGSYLEWLTESRQAGLARDQKNHIASSWLLQCAAFARLCEREPVLAGLRHRYKTSMIRSQIVADGSFPAEIRTDYPYRNSMLNLDLLAGSCQILSSASGYGSLAIDNLWETELADGPGMRSAIAFYYPVLADRGRWPVRADLTAFKELPVRYAALLFAGRAYTRPEYIALWKRLNPDPTNPEILQAFPIRQPVLWVRRS